MRRLDAPDRHHYVSHFIDHAASWLRSFGVCTDIGESFTAACLAFGDIAYSDFWTDGRMLELGLNAYTGRLASAEAWRHVIATGELLPPVTRALSVARASPSHVRYG
jgi:hypothetical protein